MSSFGYLKVSLFALFVLAMNGASAGSFSAPDRHSNLVFYGAYAAEDRVAILDGSVSNNRLRGGNGLKDTSIFHSAAFGAGYWFPLYDHAIAHFNGIAYVEHTPGPTVDVLNLQSGDEPVWAELKTNRTNFGIGINAVVPYRTDMYFVGAISGGISRRHVSAVYNELNTGGSNGPFDDSESYAMTTSQPFISAEIGLGKELSHHSTIYAFVSASASRKDEPFIMGSGGNSNSASFLDIPHHWWKIGVALTREINIL